MFFLYQHCAALHRQAIWCKSQLSLDLDTFLVLFSFLQNLCKIWCSGRQVDTIELPSGSMQPRSPSTHRFCLNFINLELHIYCICTSSTNFEGLLNIRRTAPFFWGGNNNYIYTYHWYIFAVLVEYWGSIAGVKCKYLRSLPTWYIHSLHNLRKWPFDPVDPVLWNEHQSF